MPLALLGLLAALQSAEVEDLRTRKSGADWPSLLGPERDGKSPEKGIAAAWPPRLLWTRDLGESYGPCSVQSGRLFHFDRYGDKLRLTCMRSETGGELWRFETPTDFVDRFGDNNGARCPPVVDGDRVYAFGPDGVLFCVRVRDGVLVWKKETSRDFGVVENFFGVGSTPVVEGDLLIVQVGGSPADSPGINSGEVRGLDSGVVAFEKRTGAVKWKATDELASYSSPVCATIGGRRWGFVFARGGLVGFEPATGKVEFRFPWRAESLQSVNASNPVIAGDLVFVSEAYSVGSAVLRVRPGGCDVVWQDGRKRDRSMSCYWNTPIHVDGFLYGASGMQGGGAELRCIELATGKVRWSERGMTQCSLLHVDGHFVSLSEDGTLRLVKVNPDKYEELAKALPKTAGGEPLLGYPTRAAALLSHGLLYARGKDRLACFELIPAK